MQIDQDSCKQVCGAGNRNTSNVEWLRPEPKYLNGGTGAGVWNLRPGSADIVSWARYLQKPYSVFQFLMDKIVPKPEPSTIRRRNLKF